MCMTFKCDQVEEFQIELGGVNFTPVILAKDMTAPSLTKSTTPKVLASQHDFCLFENGYLNECTAGICLLQSS